MWKFFGDEVSVAFIGVSKLSITQTRLKTISVGLLKHRSFQKNIEVKFAIISKS